MAADGFRNSPEVWMFLDCSYYPTKSFLAGCSTAVFLVFHGFKHDQVVDVVL